jgi:FdhE protein
MSDGLITLNSIDAEIPTRPSHVQRIQRAHDLSGQCASASELLSFYSRLVFLQQHVFESLVESGTILAGQDSSSWPLLIAKLTPMFPEFARSMSEIGPSPLRELAKQYASSDVSRQTILMSRFWDGTLGQSEDNAERVVLDRSVALAFLQPYAEWLAQSRSTTGVVTHRATCPVCSSKPVCAVLHDQYHGARRGLVCSLCMHEWSFPRVRCLSCGEERFESLPVFTAEEMAHVRIDACDTCRFYIKTIDLTRDGRAIAVVDELASASLDLWARDAGYSKVALNIAAL